ncbi:Toxin-antitoxin biofilm protein TabA [Poriferisphaera corsica]|uniref:Toxin-antitoxin biofilm protein TabA n=1 Tax=Poriferisphaera corsica TaxID=2528020 RepID=A0A517YWS5_9BACT|nr:YhcH/YjgK/YiaL family protein [Poriferisphaera corsica]QDU34671.1 Toxin-antitoxin biofilm protein TabA [Poriferisphaera corsica]
MIFDKLKNANKYGLLFEGLIRGFKFLREVDISNLNPGRNEISGEDDHGDDFANFDTYTTKDHADARWESHQQYADIQYIVKGTERIGVSRHEDVQIEEVYDPDRDIAFYTGLGSGTEITLNEGDFAVFMPWDVHKPCIAVGDKGEVQKIVVKVRVR